MKILDFEIQLEQYEDKLDLIRKYQKYIYLFIIIIVIFNLYVKLIVPKVKNINDSNNNLKEYELILLKKKQVLKERENIEKALKGLEEQLVLKEANFFNENGYKEFTLNNLSKIAIKNDINILTIDYGKENLKEKNIYISPLTIKCEGTYQGLLNFINELENYDKIIRVATIVISKKANNSFKLQQDLKIEAYILKK